MDAKQATFEMDSMVGALGEQIGKMAFCRQMIEDVANSGGEFDRQGEKPTMMGLAYVLSDVEAAYEKLQQDVHRLFDEARAETETKE